MEKEGGEVILYVKSIHSRWAIQVNKIGKAIQ